MGFTYQRDDARRIVLVALDGPGLSGDAFVELFTRYGVEDVWSWGVLYDLRRRTGQLSLADLRGLMGKAASLVPPGVTRGPIALLTQEPTLYASACTYSALVMSKQRIQVFRDLAEANAWLDQQTQR